MIKQLKHTFSIANAMMQLIYINVAVFVVLKIISIVFLLFNIHFGNLLIQNLAVPSELSTLLYRPWTPLSYMFLHNDFFHILFNMLCLYSFGKVLTIFFTEKQLVGLYLFGGLIGATFYILSYNIFPYYTSVLHSSMLLGASGSVIAIIVASAIQAPNMKLQLLLLGNIPLKYIAIVTVLLSFFGITSSNAGGELAHLGGALAGYIFVVSLQKGKDLTLLFSKTIDFLHNLFVTKKLRVQKKSNPRNARMTDAEFNMNKARNMQEIDRILDKIKSSGYDSLTSEEKKRIFNQGQK
jgi:membrane associated rhomboid family serine protease